MMKSCVREYHWEPSVLGSLYLDAEDYLGIEFWYNDIKEVDSALKVKNAK